MSAALATYFGCLPIHYKFISTSNKLFHSRSLTPPEFELGYIKGNNESIPN